MNLLIFAWFVVVLDYLFGKQIPKFLLEWEPPLSKALIALIKMVVGVVYFQCAAIVMYPLPLPWVLFQWATGSQSQLVYGLFLLIHSLLVMGTLVDIRPLMLLLPRKKKSMY